MKTNTTFFAQMMKNGKKEIPALKVSEKFCVHKSLNTNWYSVSDIDTGLVVVSTKKLSESKDLAKTLTEVFLEFPYQNFDAQELYKKWNAAISAKKDTSGIVPEDVEVFQKKARNKISETCDFYYRWS